MFRFRVTWQIAALLAILLALLLAVAAGTTAPPARPAAPHQPPAGIRVDPATEVEVGEEVLFDANHFTYTDRLVSDFVEWDFGDGHIMAADVYSRSGIAVVHFYMQPDIFTVTMTVRDRTMPTTVKATASFTMTVTGEAPMAGFELWHAPFHVRTAQHVYVQVPESVTQNSANRLLVTLTSDGYSATLLDKTALQAEETFLLNHAGLPQGDYVLQAELLAAGDQHLSVIKEKFSKAYEDVPRVGIDENNAFRVNGELFFPVTSWLLDRSHLYDWKMGGYINTLYNEGWYESHDLTSWQDYVQQAETNDFMLIGEDRWTGKVENMRNSNTDDMVQYIQAAKDSPAMLMWMWDDEPNMGGWVEEVPPQGLAAWTYVSHREDAQHPVLCNMYGYIYLPTYLQNNIHSWYNFIHSDDPPVDFSPVYGDKKYFIADALGIPIFSMENYQKPMLHDPDDPDRAAIDLHMQAVDLQQEMNYGFLPTLAFVATADVSPDEYFGTPTATQVRMLSWLMVAHNVKGIHWYPYMGIVPPENYAVMAEFTDQVTALTPVILGPQSNQVITDTANVKGRRVDTLVRQEGNALYIFTARLTELDYLDDPAAEPENITVDFTLPGLPAGARVVEYRDYQRTWEYHPVSAGQNSFQFNVATAPLQPGTVLLAGYREDLYNPWTYVFDDGEGGLSRRDGNTGQTVSAGTIDYVSGDVTVDFGLTLSAGAESILAAYTPVRGERVLPLVDGSFQDTFDREAVHIYKITFPETLGLELHGAPADRAIGLDWTVANADLLPVTATWQIRYQGPAGSPPSPVTDIVSPTRAYTLTGLTNDAPYTVTLSAMVGSVALMSDTVTVTPTGPQLGLELRGTPADRAIGLDWTVANADLLPGTATWQINYVNQAGSAYLPITGIVSPTRAYTLTGLTNGVLYTVTLSAVANNTELISDTVAVTPAGAPPLYRIYLPLVLRTQP